MHHRSLQLINGSSISIHTIYSNSLYQSVAMCEPTGCTIITLDNRINKKQSLQLMAANKHVFTQ